MDYWIVTTIGKHIIAQDALAGGCVGIGIDETAHLGIVITGLEIVERGLGVVKSSCAIRGNHFTAPYSSPGGGNFRGNYTVQWITP